MKRGFTLIEILVTSAILSFLIAGIFAILNVADRSQNLDMGLLGLQQEVRQAMDGMTREIRQSGRPTNLSVISDNITIGDNGTSITFSIPYNLSTHTSISNISYYLDYLDSNCYQNNNCYPIKRQQPAGTGTTKILANDINSLNFSLSGNIMQIQLGAAKTVRQRALSFFLTEKVRLRNE